jgi:hypothetical protein
MAGLKTLAKELQSKGRNGDTILAHINPQEAGILKALGGSGTINPDTGLPEYFIKKITRPFVDAVKTVQNIPGIKQISDVSTQAFKPIDQALVGLDKTVGKSIPGGWGTLGMAAASFIPGAQFLPGGALGGLGLTKTAAMTGLGALTGSGILRPNAKFNLQGALIGGAAAYGSSQLSDYLAAAGGAPTDSGALAQQGGSYTLPGGSTLVTEPPLGVMDSISKYAGDVGRSLTSSGSDLVTEPSMYDRLASSFSSTGGGADATFKNLSNLTEPGYADVVRPAAMPPTPTMSEQIADFGKSYIQNVKDVGSGVKNLITEPGAVKATTAATGINPMQAAGALMYGGTGIMALDEQEKYLEEAKRANAISQAEYDKALGEINRQRDYAADVVSKNPLTIPDIDVSGLGTSRYKGSSSLLYPTSSKTLYAMGGQVDDELGGDYSAMGMDQGNLQKGLFGMGYAAGGQIDMGNGYNPFANLPSMGGSLGAIGAQQTAQTQPSFAQSPYGSISPYTGDTFKSGNADMFGLSGNSLMSMFNPSAQQNTPQMSPNADQNPNTSMGGFASPSSFYGGGGGSGLASYGGGNSNAFPLEGQYGIVKMAAGGMPPRFLSGGGDGMSDSIKATINDNQPARLADGEFVIPADVVSHLGNGSSKAGAKQLYSMMDKVRKARTGNPKQGKQINPRKYMPA